MKILRKAELRVFANNPNEEERPDNILQLVEAWKNDVWISEKECEEVKRLLARLNYQHHNDGNFSSNFAKIFEQMDRGHFDNVDKMIPQTLDRIGWGADFGGIEISTGFNIFAETAEMGFCIYFCKKEVTKENVQQALEMCYWLEKSIPNPSLAVSEIYKIQLDNALPDENTNKIKKTKL